MVEKDFFNFADEPKKEKVKTPSPDLNQPVLRTRLSLVSKLAIYEKWMGYIDKDNTITNLTDPKFGDLTDQFYALGVGSEAYSKIMNDYLDSYGDYKDTHCNNRECRCASFIVNVYNEG